MKNLTKTIEAKMLSYAKKHLFMHKWMGEESFDLGGQIAEIMEAFSLSSEFAADAKRIARAAQDDYFAKAEAKRRKTEPKKCFICYRRPVVIKQEDMCQECYDKWMAEYQVA